MNKVPKNKGKPKCQTYSVYKASKTCKIKGQEFKQAKKEKNLGMKGQRSNLPSIQQSQLRPLATNQNQIAATDFAFFSRRGRGGITGWLLVNILWKIAAL